MPFDARKFGLGWNPAAEPQHATEFAKLACAAAPVTDKLPDEVDPPIPVNNQGPFPSCEGNALVKVLEFDHFIDTGVYVKLSARMGYLISRIVDGTIDDDSSPGASISGGSVAAGRFGLCKEVTLPYWDFENGEEYSNNLTPESTSEGVLHKLRCQCDVPDWNFGHKFIGSGQGGFSFGINWYESLANYDGSEEVITSAGGGSYGGHALCVIGYKLMGGTPVPKIWNSHSTAWGNKGTALMDPDLLFRLIRQAGFGAKGMSGLPAFATRKYKHVDGGYG